MTIRIGTAAWALPRDVRDAFAPGAAALPGGWRGLAYFRLHGSPKPYWSSYDGDALAAWHAKSAR